MQKRDEFRLQLGQLEVRQVLHGLRARVSINGRAVGPQSRRRQCLQLCGVALVDGDGFAPGGAELVLVHQELRR